MTFSTQSAAQSAVTLHKRKFNGALKSEWQGELLAPLAEGWLMVLHHPERHLKWSDGAAEHAESLFLHCLNMQQPLTVLLEYDGDGWFVGAKCDAALPATLEKTVAGALEEYLIEFVDLDLDVMVEADLASYLRDEMTFARNRAKMGYPEAVVQQAHDGIALAQRLIGTRQFPFDARFAPRLDVAALQLVESFNPFM